MAGAKSYCSCFATLVASVFLLLNVAAFCNGGKTSTFVRKPHKSVDMPIDSDVFVAPSGYNAPQQVPFYFPFLTTNICCINW